MSKVIDRGGYAFPAVVPGNAEGVATLLMGMSLRDWFAGQAAAGYLAFCPGWNVARETPSDLAKFAFACADAMLAERKKAGAA